jgi:hypothetical protein
LHQKLVGTPKSSQKQRILTGVAGIVEVKS